MCDITPAEYAQLAVLLRLIPFKKSNADSFFSDPSYGLNVLNVNFSYLGVRGLKAVIKKMDLTRRLWGAGLSHPWRY